MALWRCGQFVELDGLLAAVVGVEGDPCVPEGHVALWFGEPKSVRKSQGGSGGLQPEVWTVPEEYCSLAVEPVVRH